MYLRNVSHILTMKNTFIFLIFAALLISSVVSVGSAIAQNQNQSQNQSSSTAAIPENQTMASISGSPQTVIANQTTVPVEQTTVTVNQTTKPIDQSQIQPLGNQTLTQQPGNLSNLENKTLIQPTGPATTTIANKTTVPFNQTTIGMDNMTN